MKARAFVRIPCHSHADSKELALRLQADEYHTVRHGKAVIARTETLEEAELLARRLQSWVGSGSTRIWETAPRNPDAILARATA